MKFKVGDKVKVVRKYGKASFLVGNRIGSVRTITSIKNYAFYPYYTNYGGLFHAKELKLIKKGNKNGTKK